MADRREYHGGIMGHRNGSFGMWFVLLLVIALPAGYAVWQAQFGYERAPDFTLTSTGYENFSEGEPVTFSLSDYRGKTVLLDMMAVLCESCRVLTDVVLRPVYEEFGDDPNFVLLSIDTWADPDTGYALGENERDLIHLQKSEQLAWRHAMDSDDVWRKYSAVRLPKIVIVDGEGRIVYERGGIPDADAVKAVIAASLSGEAREVPVLRLGLVTLGLVAGVASFFSPCSVGLMPAYLGFLLHGARGAAPGQRLRRTLVGGVATGLGIVAMYAVIAALLFLAGPLLRPHLESVRPLVALTLVLLGILMFFQVSWDRLARMFGMGRVDGRRGFFVFGLGYGLAAFGCTGPAFLPILLGGFAEGPGVGAAVFFAYTLAVAGLVVLAAALVASGEQGRLARLLEKTVIITRISAVLLLAAGLYLLWFSWRAGSLDAWV
jgi:cytochrome c-type biogenesis protein